MFFFSSRRRHTRFKCDWSSDVCSSDLKHDLQRLYGLVADVPEPFERPGDGNKLTPGSDVGEDGGFAAAAGDESRGPVNAPRRIVRVEHLERGDGKRCHAHVARRGGVGQAPSARAALMATPPV